MPVISECYLAVIQLEELFHEQKQWKTSLVHGVNGWEGQPH